MIDLKLLRRLVRLMTGAGITELEIDDAPSGVRVRLKRGGEGNGGVVQPMLQVLPGAAVPLTVPVPVAGAGEAAPEAVGEAGIPPGHEQIVSPMVGTFYRSASPDSDPFVDVGGSVDEESVICIIEAMKVMNEIKAELRGVVVEILVENGEPIEFGQPLFLMKTS